VKEEQARDRPGGAESRRDQKKARKHQRKREQGEAGGPFVKRETASQSPGGCPPPPPSGHSHPVWAKREKRESEEGSAAEDSVAGPGNSRSRSGSSSSSSSSSSVDWRKEIWRRGCMMAPWMMANPAMAAGWGSFGPMGGPGMQHSGMFNGNWVNAHQGSIPAWGSGSSKKGKKRWREDDGSNQGFPGVLAVATDPTGEAIPVEHCIPAILERAQEITVDVPKIYIAKVIGKQGAQVRTIRQASGAQIDARNQDSDPCQVKIVGTLEAIEKARDMIWDLVELANLRSGVVLEIARAKIGKVIGIRGAQINEIQVKSGAKIDVDRDSDPCKVVIGGDDEAVEHARKIIMTLTMEEQAVDDGSEYMDLPKWAAGAILGIGGSRLREIQSLSNAKVDVDKTLPNVTRVRITGDTADIIAHAKQLVEAASLLQKPGVTPAQSRMIYSPEAQIVMPPGVGKGYGKTKAPQQALMSAADALSPLVQQRWEEQGYTPVQLPGALAAAPEPRRKRHAWTDEDPAAAGNNPPNVWDDAAAGIGDIPEHLGQFGEPAKPQGSSAPPTTSAPCVVATHQAALSAWMSDPPASASALQDEGPHAGQFFDEEDRYVQEYQEQYGAAGTGPTASRTAPITPGTQGYGGGKMLAPSTLLRPPSGFRPAVPSSILMRPPPSGALRPVLRPSGAGVRPSGPPLLQYAPRNVAGVRPPIALRPTPRGTLSVGGWL